VIAALRSTTRQVIATAEPWIIAYRIALLTICRDVLCDIEWQACAGRALMPFNDTMCSADGQR
jgi:hypothetical protein